MLTDADLEMAGLEAAAEMRDAGVCPLCEDVLDPMHPKWARNEWPWADRERTRRCTAAEWAEAVGPFDASLGYHHECMRNAGLGDLIR